MKSHKQIIIIFLLLILAGTVHAIDVGYDLAPGFSGYSILLDGWMADLDDLIGGINTAPKKLMTGFADTSVFSSHGATQRAFGDYKLFAFTFGVTAGLRIHTSPSQFMSEFETLQDTLNDKGDLSFGTSPGINAQVGINGSFLLDGLYLGLRFGYLNLKKGSFPLSGISIEELTRLNFSTLHIGAVANYKLLDGVNFGVFRWRGLDIGTGILFQRTTYGFNLALSGDYSTGSVSTKPELYFDMKTTTCTIPMEINTAIQLLWFLNLGVGAGVDFAFGKNELSLGVNSAVYESNTYIGKIWAKGGGTVSPTFFNPKVMANLGIKLGPVIIDIPASYYFSLKGDGSTGLSLGFTLGVVF